MGVPLKSALSLLVASQLVAAPAVARDPLESSGCSQALQNHYGEAFTFKLVSRRNSRQGLMIKVAVRDASDTSGNWRVRYATCRVARGDKRQVRVEDEDAGNQ